MYTLAIHGISFHRLSTDIEFGIRNGMKTLLVLTGLCQRNNLEDQNGTKPQFFCESVAGFLT